MGHGEHAWGKRGHAVEVGAVVGYEVAEAELEGHALGEGDEVPMFFQAAGAEVVDGEDEKGLEGAEGEGRECVVENLGAVGGRDVGEKGARWRGGRGIVFEGDGNDGLEDRMVGRIR